MMGPMGHMRDAASSEEKAGNKGEVIKRLLSYVIPYWKEMLVGLVLIIFAAGSQALGPALIGQVIDKYISVGIQDGLTRIMVMLLGVYLVGFLAMRFQIQIINTVSQNLLKDLRDEIMKKIQSLSLQYLEGSEAGDLMSRLVNDVDTINSFFSNGLAQMIGQFFALIGIVIAMIMLDWRLALVTFAMVPFMLLTTGKFTSLARNAFRRTRHTIGDVSADVQEELSGVKVAQAFNRTDKNIEDFEKRNAANRDANVQATAITSAFAPAMDILTNIDMAFVAGLGGYLALNNMITIGVVVAFTQYVQNFFRPISMVAQLWTTAQSSFAAAERVFDLLDIIPDIEDKSDAVEVTEMNGEVTFEKVSFSYADGEKVLEDIDLQVEPGKTIAIVGPTGAGKTTMVSLIPRFYEVESGRLLVDGRDVRDVTQQSLRSKMGLVLQEPFLFSGTVRNNIRYGNLNATDEQVEAAAEAAKAHDFILRLPEGYETHVGERGSLLSQGQRQLISIARAILADPRILILDEATASVDTRTEVLIQEALNHLLEGRTSFVIAHRLSTIRNADLIVVLAENRIVEQGTHTELLEKQGLYADLYNRQFYKPSEEIE